MSANCGFCCISSLPQMPALVSADELEKLEYVERRKIEEENEEKLKAYRTQLETLFIDAIRNGLLSFALPEKRVLDYTDTVRRIELVKGRTSTPGVRLEELIQRELKWKDNVDPVERFNVRGNWTSRKFGNGDYRRVDKEVHRMLSLTPDEREQWMDRFMEPMRERMNAED